MAGPEPDVAQDLEGGERPWELPGAVRKDCEPHRGNLLGALGKLSLAVGVLAAALGAPLVVGLPLGLLTVTLAERDLGRIGAGAMDPRGREQTELARWRGKQGLALSVTAPFTAVALWAVLVTVAGLVLSLAARVVTRP
jgi:hypothetical protein